MKRLYRTEKDKMLSGVCGGLGAYFNIDPTLVRLGWVILIFASCGFAIFAYIIAAIIVPTESQVQ